MTQHDASDRAIVRLIPKAEARAIRHGYPWVYANELVTDRRTRGLPAGSIALLEDANRTPMGVLAVNPASKIICRMLDQNPEAIDRLCELARKDPVTLVYGAKDEAHNNAVVLKEYLERRLET